MPSLRPPDSAADAELASLRLENIRLRQLAAAGTKRIAELEAVADAARVLGDTECTEGDAASSDTNSNPPLHTHTRAKSNRASIRVLLVAVLIGALYWGAGCAGLAEAGKLQYFVTSLRTLPGEGPHVGPELYAVDVRKFAILASDEFDLSGAGQREGGRAAMTDAEVEDELSVHLAAESLANTFVPLSVDAPTTAFLAWSRAQGKTWWGRLKLATKHHVFSVLSKQYGYSRVDASAFVDRSQLFVASTEQLRRLLAASPGATHLVHAGAADGVDGLGGAMGAGGAENKKVTAAEQAAEQSSSSASSSASSSGTTTGRVHILDIGAGRGSVTMALAAAVGAAASDVTAVEESTVEQTHLRAEGFHAMGDLSSLIPLEPAILGGRPRRPLAGSAAVEAAVEAAVFQDFDGYEIVSLLNVLDRVDDPLSLLELSATLLHPTNGIMLIAIVLPICPYVYTSTDKDATGGHLPTNPLKVMPSAQCHARPEPTFEFAAAAFAAAAVEPAGLEVVAWTRLPYLSSGDVLKTHYSLDVALFVLKRQALSGYEA